MNKNSVEYIGHYGQDLTIALSAWTSTSRELDEKKIQRAPKLIVQLWSQGHETPFEKTMVHFLVNTDIASHIHLIKHRIAVPVNGESARYKEIKEDKYYIPEDWKNTNVNLLRYWESTLAFFTEQGNGLYHQCLEDLEPILGRKRAKETARYFKTYNSQIQADVAFNLRSFAHFLRLRNSEHAQVEIRQIAQQMQDIVMNLDDEPFKTAMWVITRANELYNEMQDKISKQLMEEYETIG